jgi:magnesium transporter
MTIVCARRYDNTHPPALLDLGAADLQPPEGKGVFDWIGVHAPTKPEMQELARIYGLHPLAVEDALAGNQLPKLERYDGHMFLVARTACRQGGMIQFGETAIFVGRHFIITVRHGSDRGHAPLREQLERSPAMLRHGTDFVLHAILDYLVDAYSPIVDEIEEEVLKTEERSLDHFLSKPDLRALLELRRMLVRFQRQLGPMDEVLGQIVNLDHPEIDRPTRPFFRDVLDHVRRVDYRLNGLRETLGGVLEASSLMEQQRQGAIARQLTAWAAILAVFTAIAGIYGMNFKFMPELEWRYGYFVVLGAMATICGALYWRFKRSGWL